MRTLFLILLLPMLLLASNPTFVRDFTPGLTLGSHGMDFPAEGLLGQIGTVLVKFRQDQPTSAERANRAIFTVRCHSRLQFGLSYIPTNSRKFLFHFGDRDGQFYHELPEEFDFGRDYTVAVAWDGALVMLYFDGRLLAEYPQPVPVEKLDALHLGPYRDDWVEVIPWADDTIYSNVQCFDEALSPAEIATLSGSTPVPSWQECQTQLVIPIQDTEAIDWSYAASLPELVSLNSRAPGFASPDGRFLLAAAPEALHLSFEYVIPAGNTVATGQPRTAESEPEVWGSESFEFYVNCAGHNYRFAGNVAGGYAENRDNDAEWNGFWSYESHLEMQIDNSQRWRGEAVIPWSTLESNGVPADEFSFCLARTWCLPDYTAATVLYGNPAEDSYNQPSRYCQARFAYGTPVIQQLSRVNPERGEFHQSLRFASPQDATVEYQVDLLREDGLAEPLPLYRRTLELPANTPVEIEVTARIPSDTYDLLRYRLIDLATLAMTTQDAQARVPPLPPLTSAGEAPAVLQCLAPFALNQVAVELKPHYLSGTIEAIVQPSVLQKLAGGTTALEVALVASTGQELWRQPLGGETMHLPFPPGSPSGKYILTILSKDNKVITSSVFDYPGLGEWHTAQFPNDVVLPPFTPLEGDVGAGHLSMWGRAYDYAGGALPTQVTTQGQECFLAAPQLVANGIPLETASATSQITGHSATHAEIIGATDFTDGTRLESTGFAEYDGVTYHRLRLTATRDLKDVTLRFTLAPDIAKYLHASVNTAWGSKLTRAVPEGHSEYQFYPMFWLGMED